MLVALAVRIGVYREKVVEPTVRRVWRGRLNDFPDGSGTADHHDGEGCERDGRHRELHGHVAESHKKCVCLIVSACIDGYP